jgi:hypothetical protein
MKGTSDKKEVRQCKNNEWEKVGKRRGEKEKKKNKINECFKVRAMEDESQSKSSIVHGHKN